MIDGLKSYPAYKDSGVSWILKIPSVWEIRRNGQLFGQRKETGFPDLPILEVSLKTGVSVRDFHHSKRKQVMSDRDKYQRACQGDIAYNMMRMWQGAVGVAPVDGLISPAYVVARPFADTETTYFAYLFRTAAYMVEVNNYSRGIVSDRNRLYWDEFKQIPTPYPPPDEQRGIVRFLDHADRRIRHYIRSKKKLIALLNEQKQAIIHQAVTRGLDPSTRYKPSGVEWLGDVPEHWIVAPVNSRYIVQLGKMLDSSRITGRHLRPYLRVFDVQWDHINTENLPEMDFDGRSREKFRLIPGDLLINEGGSYPGRSAIWAGQVSECYYQKALHRLRPHRSEEDSSRFFFYLMYWASHYGIFIAGGNETTIEHLPAEKLRKYRFAFPPFAEQESIVAFLDNEISRIDSLILLVRRSVHLLQECRSRLIADVVTGKLDVSEAADRLPEGAVDVEAVEELESLIENGEETEDLDLEEAMAEAEA